MESGGIQSIAVLTAKNGFFNNNNTFGTCKIAEAIWGIQDV